MATGTHHPPAARASLRLVLRLRIAVLAEAAVALDRAAAVDHHVAVLGLGHARHAARHLLEAQPVGGADLGEEVDVAAEADAFVEVAPHHRGLLVFRHRPLVEVGARVGVEALAVRGLHQRHAELVEPVALAGLVGIEDGGAGDVGIGLVERHGGVLGAVRSAIVSSQATGTSSGQ
jgi:hypothetical protein